MIKLMCDALFGVFRPIRVVFRVRELGVIFRQSVAPGVLADFTAETLGLKPAEGDFDAYLAAWTQGSEGLDWDAWERNLAGYVNTTNE